MSVGKSNPIKRLEIEMQDGQIFSADATAIKEVLIDILTRYRDETFQRHTDGRITIVFEVENFTWGYNLKEEETYQVKLEGRTWRDLPPPDPDDPATLL